GRLRRRSAGRNGGGQRSDPKFAGPWAGSAGTGGGFRPAPPMFDPRGTNVGGPAEIGGGPDLSGAVRGTVQGELVKLSLPTATLGELRAKGGTMTGEVSAGLPVNLRRAQ